MTKPFFSPFLENPFVYREWIFVCPWMLGNTSVRVTTMRILSPVPHAPISHNPESWFQVGSLSLSFFPACLGPSPSLSKPSYSLGGFLGLSSPNDPI